MIGICARGMINALTAHAKEHNSHVLNVKDVMEMDVRSNLVSA